MKASILWLTLTVFLLGHSAKLNAQIAKPSFNVVALYENGGHHVLYAQAAIIWLNKLAADSNFSITYIQNTESITDSFLNRFQLFIQLDYPPYGWTKTAAEAFKKYIEQGKGGWIGFHHATLLGEFDGFGMWQWFSTFMGDIRFKNYIESFADGEVKVEDKVHPIMKNIPATFKIDKEEWYTYDKSPRPNVQVIASVNENTYSPTTTIKMGDHPVVWSNEKVAARNVYIFMGHSPDLFKNENYCTIFKNAIFWAVSASSSLQPAFTK